MPTRILIAPNAFKNSLDAPAASLAIQTGLMQSRLDCVCTCFPVGDGGDGTGTLMREKLGGTVLSATVANPFGRPVTASFGVVDAGKTAIIELAAASGLHLVAPGDLNPLRATSFGTGELMKYALDAGSGTIVLAIGGSATVDGGTGILRALGIRFLDGAGHELTTPDELAGLTQIDVSALDQRLLTIPVTVLCDVDNPLLGPAGAAAVFGPQKGATPGDVQRLEAGLTTFARVTQQQTGIDVAAIRHGGAAGGVAAGLRAFLNATLVNGIEFFLDFTGFDAAVTAADLVVTGEGSLDEQTLHGKGPVGVARRAKAANLPVIGLAGQLPPEYSPALNNCFDALFAIGHGPADLPTALSQTASDLTRTARQLGNLLAAAGTF